MEKLYLPVSDEQHSAEKIMEYFIICYIYKGNVKQIYEALSDIEEINQKGE